MFINSKHTEKKQGLTMPSCELCGRSMKGRGKNVTIEGARMNVCPECAYKFGGGSTGESEQSRTSPAISKPSWIGRPDTSTPKTRQFQPSTPHSKPKHKPRRGGPLLDEMFLIEDYASVIRSARQKRGFSQEELAQKVGERVATLQSIESGRLKPIGKTIRGLERELDISLLESVGSAPVKVSRSKGAGGPTLGDIVKVKRKKSQKSE